MAGAAPAVQLLLVALSASMVSSGHRSQRATAPCSPGALVKVALMAQVVGAGGVTCPSCADTITGCKGGADCPLRKTPQENAAALQDASGTLVPSMVDLLPPSLLCTFTRPVLETLAAVARAPRGGGKVDLSRAAMAASTTVVKAAMSGACGWDDAGLELAARLEAASDEKEIAKVSAAIQLLKSAGEKASTVAQDMIQTGMGVYTFVWAKVGAHLDALEAGTVRLLVKSTGSASTSDLTAKIRRPKNAEEFFRMIFLWLRVVTALGLVSFFVVHDFLQKVVFDPIQNLKIDFKVASEHLLLFFREIETDPTRALHLGNVHGRGNGDVLMAEARQNASTFFRTGGGNLHEKGVKWNGKTSPGKQPCVAFNFAKEHKANALDADGCCKFAHICMQWVSDKGPRGMCGGDHPKAECTYDTAKKLDKPLA
jgi:hypothetical protein